MLEDTNSLDAAHEFMLVLFLIEIPVNCLPVSQKMNLGPELRLSLQPEHKTKEIIDLILMYS